MKSLKEFFYLTKYENIFFAVFYLIYKAGLKFHNFSFIKAFRKRKEDWIETIYSHLNVLNNSVEVVNGRKLTFFSSNENDFQKIYLRPFSSDYLVYNQVIVRKTYQAVIEIYNQIFKEEAALFC